MRAGPARLLLELLAGAPSPEIPQTPGPLETQPARHVLDLAWSREEFARATLEAAADGAFRGAILTDARRAELRFGPDR